MIKWQIWINTTTLTLLSDFTDHGELFKLLNSLQGTLEQKSHILDRAVYECYRFKRLQLADKLLQYKDDLVSSKVSATAQVNGDAGISSETQSTLTSSKPTTATAQDCDPKTRTIDKSGNT